MLELKYTEIQKFFEKEEFSKVSVLIHRQLIANAADPEINFWMAKLQCHEQDWDEAQKYFTKVINLNPSWVDSIFKFLIQQNLGEVIIKLYDSLAYDQLNFELSIAYLKALYVTGNMTLAYAKGVELIADHAVDSSIYEIVLRIMIAEKHDKKAVKEIYDNACESLPDEKDFFTSLIPKGYLPKES
jgi:tetratricopeptide (TPR) repeat protein